MILTIYSNTYCIMAGTNITAQTGTNIMILTFRPERFLPGTNIMRQRTGKRTFVEDTKDLKY